MPPTIPKPKSTTGPTVRERIWKRPTRARTYMPCAEPAGGRPTPHPRDADAWRESDVVSGASNASRQASPTSNPLRGSNVVVSTYSSTNSVQPITIQRQQYTFTTVASAIEQTPRPAFGRLALDSRKLKSNGCASLNHSCPSYACPLTSG